MHYLYSFLPSFMLRRQAIPATSAEIRMRAQREEMLRLY